MTGLSHFEKKNWVSQNCWDYPHFLTKESRGDVRGSSCVVRQNASAHHSSNRSRSKGLPSVLFVISPRDGYYSTGHYVNAEISKELLKGIFKRKQNQSKTGARSFLDFSKRRQCILGMVKDACILLSHIALITFNRSFADHGIIIHKELILLSPAREHGVLCHGQRLLSPRFSFHSCARLCFSISVMIWMLMHHSLN